MLTLTDCHMSGTLHACSYRPDLAGDKIMSTLTRAAVFTVRIAAVTAATPVLAGAAAASATAKLAGWELRQLTSSPLSAQARRGPVEHDHSGDAARRRDQVRAQRAKH